MNSSIESQIRALIASTLHIDQAKIRRDATFAAEILTVEHMIEHVSFAVAAKRSFPNRSNNGGALSLR